MDPGEHVELVVGGLRFSIATADLWLDQESFFATLLKKEWKPIDNVPVTIERDGAIFKYVHVFLVTRQLPRNADGFHILEEGVLSLVRTEADFYNLPLLMQECETVAVQPGFSKKLSAYTTIRDYVSYMKNVFCSNYQPERKKIPSLTCQYASSDPASLVSLLACAYVPFCVSSQYFDSEVLGLDVGALLEVARLSEAVSACQYIVGSAVQTPFQVEARNLVSAAEGRIQSHMARCVKGSDLYERANLQLRPYKLVIHQTSGHFDQHRDTVRGDNHIGTLVVILNSEYTGGELEISHGGKTEVVTGPYSWVAMYGDCLHKINPVTSGTRVSLIYDVWVAPDVLLRLYPPAEFVRAQAWHHLNVEERMGTKDAENEVLVLQKLKSLSVREKGGILAALDRELAASDTVVICLAHMYPACQSNPSYLKGGDLALYELLRDRYDVSVEPVLVFTIDHQTQVPKAYMHAALYKDVVREVARRKEELLHRSLQHVSFFDPHRKDVNATFIIPCNLNGGTLLDFSPFPDDPYPQGNMPESTLPAAEMAVLCVAALQVTKK